jgi:hypothetical protein
MVMAIANSIAISMTMTIATQWLKILSFND